MWVFLLVLLVGFILTFIGVSCSLYFYRSGMVKASRAEKYRSLSAVASEAEDQQERQERRFYKDLAVVEGGPNRFSLLLLTAVLLLIFGLIMSAIISAFVH
ncbi:MAG TPA: hypothetical protein VKV40_15200 [Ktedonobacteraceae bacterium]|nr:hypothetical protein [Ktedonobacteraceae bacterium]